MLFTFDKNLIISYLNRLCNRPGGDVDGYAAEVEAIYIAGRCWELKERQRRYTR